MAEDNKRHFLGENGERLTTHVSSYGATVYMNRSALVNLISELQRISQADPQECYEIHISRFFSYFDKNEEYLSPKVKYTVGLDEFFQKQFESDQLKEIERGHNVENVARTPFEVTIMHVSEKALEKDADDAGEIDGPVSWVFLDKSGC